MNRRAFLGGTGSVAAGLLAGCSGILESGGDGGSRWDPIADWVAYTTDPYETRGDISLRAVAPTRVHEIESDLPPGTKASVLDSVGPSDTGIEPGDIETETSVWPTGEDFGGLYSVTLGDFSQEAVVDHLTDAGVDTIDSDGDYRILHKEFAEDAWYVVGDGEVVWIPDGTHARDRIDPILATARGERESVLEAIDPVGAVLDRLPEGFTLRLSTDDPEGEAPLNEPRFQGLQASGSASALGDGGTFEVTNTYYFVDPEYASEADVEEAFATIDSLPRSEDLTVRQDGRFVDVTFDVVRRS